MQDIERLFREFHTPIVLYLTRQLNDADLAEELAQETFVRGRVQRGEERLTIELTPRGENWFSTVREQRGANIRSENVRYTRDRMPNDCR